jgi:hypothetical protein
MALYAVVIAFALLQEARIESPRTVIQNAIQARGGIEIIKKNPGTQCIVETTHRIGDMDVPFVFDCVSMLPDKRKLSIHYTVNNTKHEYETHIVNGDKGWGIRDGKVRELKEAEINAHKEGLHDSLVGDLFPLLEEKRFKLSFVSGKSNEDSNLIGIKVSCPGHEDIKMFYRRDTWLLARLEYTAVGADLGRHEAVTTFSDYKVIEGVKIAAKRITYWDGKKYTEERVTGYKFLKTVDEKEFQIKEK